MSRIICTILQLTFRINVHNVSQKCKKAVTNFLTKWHNVQLTHIELRVHDFICPTIWGENVQVQFVHNREEMNSDGEMERRTGLEGSAGSSGSQLDFTRHSLNLKSITCIAFKYTRLVKYHAANWLDCSSMIVYTNQKNKCNCPNASQTISN